MPKVTFAKPFKHSPDGITINEYQPGEADVSDRCAEVAKTAGVLREATVPQPPAEEAPDIEGAVEERLDDAESGEQAALGIQADGSETPPAEETPRGRKTGGKR